MDIVTDIAQLRQPTKPLDRLVHLLLTGKTVIDVADLLKQEMESHHGQGLAANQIGMPWSALVIKREGPERPTFIANPEIVYTKGAVSALENCLSLPGVTVKVRRPKMVKVTGFDQYWESHTWVFHGIEARRACHEIDHLNGRLITDYLRPREKG